MGSFLDFTEIHDTGKTKVYSITPKNSDQPIGRIAWFSNWRKYTFWPECNTIYDTKCLLEVIQFINQLMEDRKSEKAN
jgi:hypothetical protein